MALRPHQRPRRPTRPRHLGSPGRTGRRAVTRALLGAVAATAVVATWVVATSPTLRAPDLPTRVHVQVDAEVAAEADPDRLAVRLEATPTHADALTVTVLAAPPPDGAAATAAALADQHGAVALVLTPDEAAGAAPDPGTEVLGAVDAAVRTLEQGGDVADAAAAFATALVVVGPERAVPGGWWAAGGMVVLVVLAAAASVTWPRAGRHRRAAPVTGRHTSSR